MKKAPADLLEEAADLIQTVGHTKEKFTSYAFDPGTRQTQVAGFCAMGAIRYALLGEAYKITYQCSGDSWNDPGVTAAQRALARHLEPTAKLDVPDVTESVISLWNDELKRTPEEVIDVMKHVAKDLRNAA